MSLNPLNELKRRLNNTETPLPKRLCLARNVIQSQNFPSAPKERVVASWLQDLNRCKILKGEVLKNVLDWLNTCDDLGNELKVNLIQIVAEHLGKNPLQEHEIQIMISFIENPKINPQLHLQIEEYLSISVILLQHMKNTDMFTLSQRLFDNLVKFYKESKKKLEFIVKLLSGANIETLFSFLGTECHNSVINVCQNIFFPINKRTYFISYLQTLIRKDNLKELIAEKGDNIQSVLKIMNTFFEFPKGRTDSTVDFLRDFIDVFVSCFRSEPQIIFAYYIMIANFFGLQQNYIVPAMTLEALDFTCENVDKTRRTLFLNMLKVLLANEVDVSVRLTDTFGEKIPKVETKKTFINFLQAVMLNQLSLGVKPDKTTIEIVKSALSLDPSLIEQKMDEILPPLMTAKKANSKVLESYIEMLNCILQTLFKLSRGTLFLNQILPNVKLNLENSNTLQFELTQKLKENENNEKIKNKIITGKDIFPMECVEMYGKLTSELMFRQNKELLLSLQKDFEFNCLMMLEEGFVSPSIIVLAEVLSAIISSFLRHSKIADHTVPLPIAEDFWNIFKNFEGECMKKFGECILKLSYNPSLTTSFLSLCLSISQLKLLNIKYSNVKLDISLIDSTSEIYDLSSILPCLNSEQWLHFAARVQGDEAVILMDNLLLMKTTITELLALQDIIKISNVNMNSTKLYLIKKISTNPDILESNYFSRALFNHLDSKENKLLASILIKYYFDNNNDNIFKTQVVRNNRYLQNSLILEIAKNITECFDNCDLLTKKLNKTNFSITEFAKENNMRAIFENITLKLDVQDETIKNYIALLKELQTPNLEENYQLITIFLLLAIKKCCQSKKITRNVNFILQSIYELSLQPPDLYQLFSTNYVFEFEDKVILKLLTLNSKVCSSLVVVKSLIKSAVRRVKIDSSLVKSIVEILLRNKVNPNSSIEIFTDPIFQISCIILPLIVKQKKIITASTYRSILADLQDKLQKQLLESFKNIDFTQSNVLKYDTENTGENLVDSDNTAALNAMAAYALTLSRYCETTNVEEIAHLDCLWCGLDFFVQHAIIAISNSVEIQQHIESSIQLLNIILRYAKKLETHYIFEDKNKLFVQIWKSLKTRLILILGNDENVLNILDDIAVTIKYLCELSTVECFCNNFVGDFVSLSILKKPSQIMKDEFKLNVTSHKVAKYLLTQCLKSNIVGAKCVSIAKFTLNNCRNLRFWIQQHYEDNSFSYKKKRKFNIYNEDWNDKENKVFNVNDVICELLKINLDMFSEVNLAAKKISLDYKYLDSIFELQHMVQYVMGSSNGKLKCEISLKAFFVLYEGCTAILNSLIVSREEMLEDRWPCYMQCYRALVILLCERAYVQGPLERDAEEKLADMAHSIEKLTQSIAKRKKHVSHISAYIVADICALIEKTPPTRDVRQHLENSIALLIQACDSSYVMPFLKRALAGSPGHVTVTNMYLTYKRYHKYVGNA